MLVLGTLSALLGLGLLSGAGAAGWANYQQRDNGYFTTPSARFAADGYALTSPRLGIMTQGRSDMGPVTVPGSIVIRGSAADPSKQIFIGIAPQASVGAYLAGVQYAEIREVHFSPFRAQYLPVPGSRIPPPPAGQSFWTATATGPGVQELKWDVRSGDWAVVVMNADASTPVGVDLQAGARSDLLWPIFIGLLIGGLLLLGAGVPLIIIGAAGLGRGLPRRPGPPPMPGTQLPVPAYGTQGFGPPGYGAPGYGDADRPQPYGGQGLGVEQPAGPRHGGPPVADAWTPPHPAPYPASPFPGPYTAEGTSHPASEHSAAPYPGAPYPAAPYPVVPRPAQPYSFRPGEGEAAYPARLTGYPDPSLSRWLWLVKWLLAIPHFIILFFLWFALIVVTIVAWFAILFTGRYPRSLFNFSVGVVRWSWRVSFYAYGALGTDRYPPFTLARTDYPADFDVDYPVQLSRGLVLVKSWLLAIPHLLIVAALTGTVRTWVERDGTWVQDGGGISLLGLLVLIAAVILLFTGQYRRGLFDLLLGLNRWIYRLITYVVLMRDEYPPFRLDMGPVDPGEAQGLPAAGPLEAPGSAADAVAEDDSPASQNPAAHNTADSAVTRGQGEQGGSSRPGPDAPSRP